MSQQEFEGQEITEFIASIPGVKLEADEGYARGTYLDLHVQVRVRSVRYEEIVAGKKKGDLQKVHVMAIENVAIGKVTTPDEHKAAVEASFAQVDASVVDEVEEEVAPAEVKNNWEMTPPQDDSWEYAAADPKAVNF